MAEKYLIVVDVQNDFVNGIVDSGVFYNVHLLHVVKDECVELLVHEEMLHFPSLRSDV